MNKTVLITGGSRGIGAETARVFHRAGWDVAFGYLHSSDAAAALQAELPGAVALCADLSTEAGAASLVGRAQARLGRLDALVCNAGVAHQGLFTELTVEQWDQLFVVNVRAAFLCCRAALPDMIRRQSGRIVTLSSMWGVTGGSCEVAYSASKAAVIGMTRALAKEVGLSGIRVNCVAPGVIDTDMNATLDAGARAALCGETPLGRMGTPAEVAEAVYFLASDKASFITGQVLGPNGGIVI